MRHMDFYFSCHPPYPTRPVTFRVFPKRKGHNITSSLTCSGAGPQAGIASCPSPDLCWKSHPGAAPPCAALPHQQLLLCFLFTFVLFIFHFGTLLENVAGVGSWYSLWLATPRVAISRHPTKIKTRKENVVNTCPRFMHCLVYDCFGSRNIIAPSLPHAFGF